MVVVEVAGALGFGTVTGWLSVLFVPPGTAFGRAKLFRFLPFVAGLLVASAAVTFWFLGAEGLVTEIAAAAFGAGAGGLFRIALITRQHSQALFH